MTAGAAATSISVTIVVLASGATVGAIGRSMAISVGEAPLLAITSTRSPRSSRRCSLPSSASVPVTVPPAASITRSVRSVTVKIRRPSVLMTSGSSTSASWVLVPEKSGTAASLLPSALTGAAAGCGTIPPIVVSTAGIGGVVIVTGAPGSARPTTPTPPSVRCAPARA